MSRSATTASAQGSATSAPETGGRNHGWQRVQQVKWTSTTTNKLLLEAGLGTYLSNWNTRERPGQRPATSFRSPSSAARRRSAAQRNGGIAGLTYRGQATWNADWIGAHTWNAAASYVTGVQQHEGRLPGRVSRGQSRARWRQQQTDLSASTTACRTS